MGKRILSEEEQRVAVRCMAAWQAYKKETRSSQAIMAEKLGFTNQSAFSQYINGTVLPNIGFVLNFASIIVVDPATLWPEKAAIIHQTSEDADRITQKIDKLSETNKALLEQIIDGFLD